MSALKCRLHSISTRSNHNCIFYYHHLLIRFHGKIPVKKRPCWICFRVFGTSWPMRFESDASYNESAVLIFSPSKMIFWHSIEVMKKLRERGVRRYIMIRIFLRLTKFIIVNSRLIIICELYISITVNSR